MHNVTNHIAKEISNEINWFDDTIIRSFLAIAALPLFWNCAGRFEYYTKGLSTLFFGHRHAAVYCLAGAIFTCSAYRDHLFQIAVKSNATSTFLSSLAFVELVGYVLIAVGPVFVLTSFLKLGLFGTYMGDYFGILMKSRIESFPFNVFANPMYMGSSMIFCGYSLINSSWVGLALALWAFTCYKIGAHFEGLFTTFIYQQAAVDKRQ